VSLEAAVWAQAVPKWQTVSAQAKATALGTIALIRLDIKSLQEMIDLI
jgi:NAD(P)H-dependent flavin oxidoreductase YrpB (nitropropane dioxygenase family)